MDLDLTQPHQSTTLSVDDELIVRLSQPGSAGLVWDVDVTPPVTCTSREVHASTESFGAPAVIAYHFSSDIPTHGHITFELRAPWRSDVVSVHELDIEFLPSHQAH